MINNIAIASDHAGYKLKQYLIDNLGEEITIKDFGTDSEESCDFPDFASEVSDFVLNNEDYRGVLICGSGVGMSIAANKISGIRAANVSDVDTAVQSVEHNNTNVLCLGSNNVNEGEAVTIVSDLIKKYGESTYGGNSHMFADSKEAWVMIQFAGGKGLWAAERLGNNSIRASRPGYIEEIPINEKNNPNFLYSKNLIKFCRNKGWYSKGPFNVNKILGDKKGKWKGVKWIENKMKKLSKKSGKINLKDVMWAIRTPKLTGDTAGYGQVVPLIDPAHNNLRMLWHSPIGAVASPFSPVFIGQTKVPEEFMMHRYLTVGESHRFLDERKKENIDTLSLVNQRIESTVSAVYECKRLFYLILQNKKKFHSSIINAFENREKKLIKKTIKIIRTNKNLSKKKLNNFSLYELRQGLKLVQNLSKNIEKRIRNSQGFSKSIRPKSFNQIW